jgi:Uma2 family endonuclease
MSRIIEVVERILVPEFPKIELPSEDGLPLESNWHRSQINLLLESVRQHWTGRSDFFAGGNMFVYYSMQQVRNRDYKGPDFFVVKNVDGTKDRPSWIVWEEDGRFPDVIVELISPTTADVDLGSKKDLYEQTFKTPEYYCYDPDSRRLLGWRLEKRFPYTPITPNDGRLWSEELNAWLGLWESEYQGIHAPWIRLFSVDGNLQPTAAEAERARAEAERIRAEAERARADAAESEAARLREELKRLQDGR